MQATEKHPISASSSGNESDFSSISISGKIPAKKENSWNFFVPIIASAILLISFLSYKNYELSKLNQILSLENVISRAENRILKDEVTELDRKPTYESGYRDALIRRGGPSDKGDYQSGWEDAMKIVTKDSNYADGYHNAIQQYGYQKGNSEYLVQKPETEQK